MKTRKTTHVRGFLIHITHYDPKWCAVKSREKPFDLDLGLEIVDALAEEGFNTLVIDCADGVAYRSHPELRRHYTSPIKTLKRLAGHARKLGMDVVPKLNFSNGEVNMHNNWMRTKDSFWGDDFHNEQYRETAFELIDEVIDACSPAKYFHIGMDEDHNRSYTQFCEAIMVLRKGLKKRRLKTVMWNDSAIKYPSGHIFVEKALAAEKTVPKDVVQVLWNYGYVPVKQVKRIRAEKFELWGAPGATDTQQVKGFRDAVVRNGGKGMLMTIWRPCRKSNRAMFLEKIRTMGPIYRGDQ